jgi:hypothetical protein
LRNRKRKEEESMPTVITKRKAAPKMPIGRMHPDPSTRYQMRIYGPTGPYDRSYGSPEMRQRWKDQYKKKGLKVRFI